MTTNFIRENLEKQPRWTELQTLFTENPLTNERQIDYCGTVFRHYDGNLLLVLYRTDLKDKKGNYRWLCVDRNNKVFFIPMRWLRNIFSVYLPGEAAAQVWHNPIDYPSFEEPEI